MPFELGIAYAFASLSSRHSFIVLEAKRFRLNKTCTDLNGIDPCIHHGKVEGIIGCILNALGRPKLMPRLDELINLHQEVSASMSRVKKLSRRKTIFSRNLFLESVELASKICYARGMLRED
jgi:hypothetical protein